MIASVRGIVQHVGVQDVVLEVGGIGLRIVVPQAALDPAPVVGQAMFLHTRLVVREESLSLHGFSTQEQREVFDLLLQVNGVGPRLAVAILSHIPPEGLRSAVAANQPMALTKVPGIGRKTAEKIIFHLKDRLKAPEATASMALEADNDVVSALTALGYSLVEAQSAVQSIPAQAPTDVAARVRLALQYFSRR
jgi:holliday junction DNA helicase RuvA